MKRITFLLVVTTLVGILILTACGGPEEPEVNETGDSVGTAVALTVAAIEAAATPIAEVATPTTSADVPATLPPAETATAQPDNTASCTTVGGLNIRSGPGLVYDPPIAAVGINATLQPIGFSPVGFPGGQWLQIIVVGANLTGWVSADPQFVICNVEYATLPVVAAPPTPTAAALTTATLQPTATKIVRVPPDLDNVAVGGENYPADHVSAAPRSGDRA